MSQIFHTLIEFITSLHAFEIISITLTYQVTLAINCQNYKKYHCYLRNELSPEMSFNLATQESDSSKL